ncbi:hypothetical protein CN558_22340 [Bacillus wiedmannii]|uniref:sulfite exporter TauE/SafE family protein n=1 Tax=Bacillus wiedmannii TaxID=1890302 RepID=UPI000BEFD38B|nr:sulfite exporter TauE/SafE family protein [Bacillus wiedmannii]PEM85138.1 hypothetical protein CN627_20745 [Bacillus wiedmannii]PEO82752.1 hypothetical protein CN558_22340 [Bacillus wiedmannii]
MSLDIIAMGFLIGNLVGLTGVGGATLLTPFLIFIGINPHIAVGTDLVYNSITKLFGTIQHWRQKTIKYQLVVYLAIGSIPGAILAVLFLNFSVRMHDLQEQIIRHSLGYLLIVTALATLINTFFLNKDNYDRKINTKPIYVKRLLIIMIGVILGFIVGLTSIGSGSLFAIALMFFYRLKPTDLVGTVMAHAFILVTVAGLLNVGFRNVDYWLVANLLLGSVPGVLIGSSMVKKVPGKLLRTFITSIILISGIKLLN